MYMQKLHKPSNFIPNTLIIAKVYINWQIFKKNQGKVSIEVVPDGSSWNRNHLLLNLNR